MLHGSVKLPFFRTHSAPRGSGFASRYVRLERVETGSSTSPPRALFKNMLHGSTLYMVAMASPSLLSLILVPIVTRYLTTADYGALDLLQQTTVVISVLLGLNFSSALGYFYFQDEAVHSRVVSTSLCGAFLLGTLAGVVGWLFSGPISRLVFKSPAYTPYLWLIFAAMPLSFLLEAGYGWLRTENRTTMFTGAVLLRLILILAGTLILLLHFGLRIGAVLGANIAASGVIALVLAAISLRVYRFSFDRVLFRRMLRFAAPLGLSAVALFVIHFGDRFVLPHYRSFSDLGVYAVAYKLGMLVSLVQSAFQAYWEAQIYQVIKRADAQVVVARTFTYLILVLAFSSLGVLVATRPALEIMTPPSYYRAAAVVPVILLAYFIRAAGDFFRILFLAKGLPAYDAATNWITAAVSFALYLLLIPRFGIMGAAWATLLTFIAALAISAPWSYRVWRYRLEPARLAKIVCVTATLSGIHFLFPRASVPAQAGQGALLLAAFAGALLLLRFPSEGEKQLLRSANARLASLFADAAR